MAVSLYTVRVVLNVLGAEDYGIYNVVAGVVTMFGFLSGAMATASQRYFSFDLGQGNTEHLKTTFSVTFQIYLLLALVIVLLAETAGLWFVNSKLVIPAERMTAANCIYQAAIVSFLLTLIITPYMASIIAHENMNVYAYVSIVEVALKLGIVFLLKALAFDKLIVYGVLLAAVALINTSIYRFYCRAHYAECKFCFVKDKALFKEIVSYSGWNLFGSAASVVKNQIINILLNLYFGAVVNAARGVSAQVNAAVVSFSQNFSTALRPQIIKSYVVNKKEETLSIVFRGCKYTFFLMYIFALPLVLEMDMILRLWLKNPPEYAVIFTRLCLIEAVVGSVSYSLMTLIQATGRIKLYQSVVGGLLFFNLPCSLVVLKLGFPPYTVMIISLAVEVVAVIARVLIARYLVSFSLLGFIFKVMIPCISVVICSLVLPCFSHFYFTDYTRLFLSVSLSLIISVLCVIFIGMTFYERKTFCRYVVNRFFNKNGEC
jgi:O-antigen/teichoic acid export membrane protein